MMTLEFIDFSLQQSAAEHGDIYASETSKTKTRIVVELLRETARRAGLPEDLVFPGTLTPPSSATPQINNGGTIPAPLSFVPAP
jgi:hypothetical protein